MSEDELKERFTEVDGVGDSRAWELVGIVEDHQPDTEAVRENLEQALDHHREAEQTGDSHYYRIATKYLERAREAIE